MNRAFNAKVRHARVVRLRLNASSIHNRQIRGDPDKMSDQTPEINVSHWLDLGRAALHVYKSVFLDHNRYSL